VHLGFDSKVYNVPDQYQYRAYARPDLWYNNYDGIKAGVHLNGNYFNYSHFIDVYFWLNTGLVQRNVSEEADINGFDPVSFSLKYATPMEKFIRKSMLRLNAKYLDGFQNFSGDMEIKSSNEKNIISISYHSLYRKDRNALEYLLYPEEWQAARYNNYLEISLDHLYNYSYGSGNINLSLLTSSLESSYSYSYLTLEVINRNHFGKFELSTRTFARYATGNNFADENALFFAGANPEELMNDKFTRSRAFVPTDWLGYDVSTNHFQQGGGLNLRGYAGYLVPEEDKDGNMKFIYKGTSGAAINAELDFEKLFPIRPSFTRNWLGIASYLFADAGTINYNTPDQALALAKIRADAGIGFAATIKKFGPLQTVLPFTLRIDFPLLLNSTPAVEPDYFDFRWVIGVGRTF
jgi:aminopeptidase N